MFVLNLLLTPKCLVLSVIYNNEIICKLDYYFLRVTLLKISIFCCKFFCPYKIYKKNPISLSKHHCVVPLITMCFSVTSLESWSIEFSLCDNCRIYYWWKEEQCWRLRTWLFKLKISYREWCCVNFTEFSFQQHELIHYVNLSSVYHISLSLPWLVCHIQLQKYVHWLY